MATFTQEQVAEAARETLKRSGKSAFDKALYEMYKDYGGGDLNRLKAAFAQSAEAQSRGVDAEKYGGSYVDPASLNDVDKERYAAYQRAYGKSARMTADTLRRYQGMTAALIEAEGKGGARVSRSGKNTAIVVDSDTWNTYGNKLFSNLHSGDAVYIEKSKKLKATEDDLKAAGREVSKRWKLTGSTENDKYYILQKSAAKKSGLVGSTVKALGGSEGMANSLDKAVGDAALPVAGLMALGGQGWALALADEAAAIGGGTRGAAAYSKVGSNLLRSAGLSKGDAERGFNYANAVGDVAQAIGAGIADSVTFGAASVANQGLEAWQKSATNQDVDWAEVGRDMAISWASYGIGQRLESAKVASGAWKSARAASAAQTVSKVWNLGGRDVAIAAAKGGNSEDLAWAAGRGFVMGSIGPYLNKGEAGAASWVLNYADAKRKGLDDENAMFSATAGMADTLINRMGRTDMKGSLVSRVKAAGTNLKSEGSTIFGAAKTGKMPEAWSNEAEVAENKRVAAQVKRTQAAMKFINANPIGRGISLLPRETEPSPYEDYLRGGLVAPRPVRTIDGRRKFGGV